VFSPAFDAAIFCRFRMDAQGLVSSRIHPSTRRLLRFDGGTLAKLPGCVLVAPGPTQYPLTQMQDGL
jgi:hypothetical protein